MKILFKILDYMISVFMGVGTVFLVSLVIDNSWNIFLAMIAGMVLGMVVLSLAIILFIYVSTAFEIFPVGMVITMLTGMITGMVTAGSGPDLELMLIAAIIFSLIVQLWIDLYDMKLKGDVAVDE